MFTTILLIIIYISFISLGLPDSLLGSAWPSMYGELNVTTAYAGYISMIISGATIISSLLSGTIISKLKTGLTTVISVAMTAIALLGFSMSTSFWQLCLWAIPLGLGAGSVDSALNNFVALYYKARHMNWLHCFWGLGATSGPIILSLGLSGGGNWRDGYRIISIIQFILVAILISSLPLWKKVGKNYNLDEKVGSEAVRGSEALKLNGVTTALLAFFCYCSVEQVIGIWGGSYLVLYHGIKPDVAASWISLYYFGITIGRFICGFVTMKISNKLIIRIGQGVIIMGILTLLIPFNDYFQLIGLFLIGFGCAPIFPALLHDTPANFGAKNSQFLMGMQMACAYIGTTFMPPVFGWIGENISFGFMPLFLGLFTVLMIISIELLNKQVVKNK